MGYKDKEQKRKYQREWIAKRRAEYMENKKCVYCGRKAEDWHHLDPRSKNTHRIWSFSRERIEGELSKCVPVCEKCHQSIHTPEIVKHGSYSKYRKGCKCDKCKASVAPYWREYRRRKQNNDADGPVLAWVS